MKTKSYDVRYCGVRKNKIENAHPVFNRRVLRYFYQFIKRRYDIHLRKDVLKEPAPWTNDKVLQEYRFTNVRREHDRETKWLIENITSNKNLSYEDKLLNVILFRVFNKHETAELIDMPIAFSKNKNWDPEQYRSKFEEAIIDDPKRVFFTGAFITGGTKRALKWYLPNQKDEKSMEMRVMYFMKYLTDAGYVRKIKTAEKEDQKAVFDVLSHTMGIGGFLGYQMFVDFTYIPEFPYSENEFVVSGPGCSKGLHFLFEDTSGMTDAECLFWLRDNIDNLFRETVDPTWDPKSLFWDLPEEDRCMNVMSLENCFCELSKYVRAKRGTGRPRKKYVQRREYND